jgi:flagellar motor protein MotB
MNDITFALAVVPPALSILAEIFNPVSRDVLTLQGFQVVDDMALVARPRLMTRANSARYYGTRAAIAQDLGLFGAGAAEVSGLIPTWISVSTATVAILHDELHNPAYWLVVPFVLASLFAITACYFFGHVRYFNIAARQFREFNTKALSVVLILLNLLLIGGCIFVWWRAPPHDAEIKPAPDAQANAIEQQWHAAQAAIATRDRQIATLQKDLQELEEFAGSRWRTFTRLRQAVGDRAGVRISGDRFVLQSDVLFARGSATLDDAAKRQLSPVIDTIKEAIREIPVDLGWLLMVEGHTDRHAVKSAQFPSNWELSTARASAVVTYAIEQGIPSTRLVAAGVAETQPSDPSATEEADRRNRRIELALTVP